jgi:hypothetical protein
VPPERKKKSGKRINGEHYGVVHGYARLEHTSREHQCKSIIYAQRHGKHAQENAACNSEPSGETSMYQL